MVSRSTASVLALGAFIFGALLYGPGNAVLGQHDHGAHHHHGAAAAAPLEVPAHCLFCLDGIAPQPTELSFVSAVERHHHVIAPAAQKTRQRPLLRRLLPPSRAPPSVTS